MFQSLESRHPKFYQAFRLFVVIFASVFYAWNLRCFAKTAGLFPGGFSGTRAAWTPESPPEFRAVP